jgi:hypothetical protein
MVKGITSNQGLRLDRALKIYTGHYTLYNTLYTIHGKGYGLLVDSWNPSIRNL